MSISKSDTQKNQSSGGRGAAAVGRAAGATASRLLLEGLETRVLMAASSGIGGSLLTIDHGSKFQPTSDSVSNVQRGPLASAGPDLVSLYLSYRNAQKAGTTDTFDPAIAKFVDVRGTTVGVDIRATGDLNAFSTQMRALGMVINASDTTYGIVEGYIPIGRLRDVVDLPQTISVKPVAVGQTAQSGLANDQGDALMNADQVRSQYGLTGAGLKVGVLSDTVDETGSGIDGSVGTGDLPNTGVQVIQDDPNNPNPTDEGRAMLEEVHDVAPGADLAFATGAGGQLNFANNIRRLAAAGSDVIVDDLTYFDEPFFQPGVIDKAISDVKDQNIPYFSSAANRGDAGFEQAAAFVTFGGRTFINFNTNGGTSTRMNVTLANTVAQLELQWDDPYNGVVGAAQNDMVIRMYAPDGKTLLYISDANNLATGLPIESIFGTPGVGILPGNYQLEIELKTTVSGGDLPSRYKIVLPRSNDGDLSFTQFAGTRAGTFGHNAGQYTISVGAIDQADAAIDDITSEDFSATGPVTNTRDLDGNLLPQALDLQKPDVSGIDGISTSFFSQYSGNLPLFFGTSAAAPNVAAVATLLRQASPSSSPDDIAEALKTTAVAANGSVQGTYDPKGGFGLVDANAAVQSLLQPAQGEILAPTQVHSFSTVDHIFIQFSQGIIGLSKNDLVLTRNGDPTNLLTDQQSLTTSDGALYRLNHLDLITQEPGIYTLTLDGAAGGLHNGLSINFTDTLTRQFTIVDPPLLPGRLTNVTVTTIGSRSLRVRFGDQSVVEDNYVVQRATDSSFANSLKTIVLPKNSVGYTDANVNPGTKYFYRVFARNLTGDGPVSNTASARTLSAGEVILDNSVPGDGTVVVTGNWSLHSASNGSAFGNTYLIDDNTGKGSKSVSYTPNLQAEDNYYIYMRWTRLSNGADNVPVDIYYTTSNGKITKTTLLVDEKTTGGSGYVLLGKFHLSKGTLNKVVIRTTGTSGEVVADAIRWLPSKELNKF